MLAVVARDAAGKVQKPQGVVRRQACRQPWAWNGLCFGVAFHEASTLGVRDVVNNVAPTTMFGLTWAADGLGNPSAVLGPSSYLEYPDNPTHDRPSTALTAYVRFKRVGTPDTWGGIFCNVHTPGVSPYSTWSIHQHETSVGQLGGILSTPGYYEFGPTATVLPSTEYVNIFLRWHAGVWLDLVAYGERGNYIIGTNGSLSGTLAYTGQGLRLNANDATDQNFAGHYSQAMVWNRKLSDTEVQWLCSDPFGWYSPAAQTVGLSAGFPLVLGGPSMFRGIAGMS